MADGRPYVIEARPRGIGPRMSHALRGRRLLVAASLALAEVIALIVWRPSLVLASAVAVIVMVLAVLGAVRVRPGAVRDVLWIVAMAQAMLVVLPLSLGLSVLAGLLIVAAVLAALILIALRVRW